MSSGRAYTNTYKLSGVKKENFVGKQTENLKNSQKPDSEEKMRKIELGQARDGQNLKNVDLSSAVDVWEESYRDAAKLNTIEIGKEQRKRWVNNTLQKQNLLAILNDAELMKDNFLESSVKLEQRDRIDDILSNNPSEINEEYLLKGMEHKSFKSNQFQLLQYEVSHLREKFEMNNRKYQIEDLIRLMDNSKKILNLKPTQKFTECDRKMEESVYYNLECRKMTFERRVGFRQFIKVYGKMIDIINDEFVPTLKTSLENPMDSYIISKANVSGDGDDVIKNTWKSIINILDDKQEYLPDLWELAMSENIYYHL